MKRIIATIPLALAVFFMLVSSAYADTKYVWDLTDQTITMYTNGQEFTIPNDETGNTRIISRMFGRFTGGNTFYNGTFTCGALQCAVGVFKYTRNHTIELTPASGGFAIGSADDVQELDARPIAAFSYSMLAYRAGIAGFIAEPIFRSILIALVALGFIPLIMNMVKSILPQFGSNELEGNNDENTQRAISDTNNTNNDDGGLE